MSLKAIHIFFIISAIILTDGFAFWSVHQFTLTGNLSSLIMGIGAFLFGALLTGYLVWFVRKLKRT